MLFVGIGIIEKDSDQGKLLTIVRITRVNESFEGFVSPGIMVVTVIVYEISAERLTFPTAGNVNVGKLHRRKS